MTSLLERAVDRVLCWLGQHTLTRTWRVDEARWWGACEYCGREGPLDAQGSIDDRS